MSGTAKDRLAQEEALARESDLRLLELTELEIAQMHDLLVREAWQDEKVRLAMSIPGINYIVAQTCLAAIGDISRFANAKKLSAYLRLNPSTRQSGVHCYHGPSLNKATPTRDGCWCRPLTIWRSIAGHWDRPCGKS
jgi:transposase